jgi:hypothetical protein
VLVVTRSHRFAIGFSVLLLAAGTTLLFIPFHAGPGGPTATRAACGTPIATWSRPDVRAQLEGLAHAGTARAATRTPRLNEPLDPRFLRLVADAARYSPCRSRAAYRLAIGGTLVFIGVGAALVALSLPGNDATARRRFSTALALVAFIAFGIRLSYVITLTHYRTLAFDAMFFHGGWATFGGKHPSALFPPGYGALLGAASWLGLRTLLWHHFVTCAVGTVTVVLTGLLGRRVGGTGVGLVSAAGAAVYPMLFVADGALMSESLYVAFVVAALLAALRVRDQPTVGRWAVFGGLIGAAVLTRGEGILLLPLLALPMALSLNATSALRRLGGLGITVVVVVAMLLPWEIRNYVVFHEPVWLALNSSTVIGGANCADAYSGEHRGSWVNHCQMSRYTPAERSGRNFVETTANNRVRRAGLRYARNHLSAIPTLMVVRVLRTWGFYSPYREIQYEAVAENRSVRWLALGWLMYLGLLPLAAYGGVALSRRGVKLWPFAAIVAMASITSALTYGNQRFHLAAEPVLLVFAAVGLMALLPRLKAELRNMTASPGAAARSRPRGQCVV